MLHVAPTLTSRVVNVTKCFWQQLKSVRLQDCERFYGHDKNYAEIKTRGV